MNSRRHLVNEAFSIEDESKDFPDLKFRKSKRRRFSVHRDSLICDQIKGLQRRFPQDQSNIKSQDNGRTSNEPEKCQEEKNGIEKPKVNSTDDQNKELKSECGSEINDNIEEGNTSDCYVNLRSYIVSCFMKFSNNKTLFLSTFDSQNKYYILWLVIGFLSVIYNYFSIPLRECFEIYNEPYSFYWIIFDYTADAVYVIDIILFQHRLQYLNNGIIEVDHKMCAQNYLKSVKFKMNIISVIPLDLFVLLFKKHRAALRLTRLFKFQTFFEFFDVLDHVVKSGHVVKFMRTMSYIIYMIHFQACGYYLFSKYIGFGSDSFVFAHAPNQYSAYIYCFYWAMKTATSIGNNPTPTIYSEYFFMNIYWLSGIFMFAVLIGQIRDIFDAASVNEKNYRKKMDTTIMYMRNLNLSEAMIKKVVTWFNYNWEHHKTLDENSLIECLPTKLKSDLAIHTHFNILSKVSLFQDCERTLLSDLILKLKPVLFLPNDFICKKGEIGTEMYIVMTGQVDVVGGPDNSIVFATLKEGSVFGEISLLALSGGNRRTADVRSKGFSTLFSLSKQDFEEAMEDYPAAHEILKMKAHQVLNRHKVIEKSTKSEAEVEKKSPEKENLNSSIKNDEQVSESERKIDEEIKKNKFPPSEESHLCNHSINSVSDPTRQKPTPSSRFQKVLMHSNLNKAKQKYQIYGMKTTLTRLSAENTFDNYSMDEDL